MSATNDPAVQELVYRLAEHAPPPPPWPDEGVLRSRRGVRVAVATAVVVALVAGALVVLTRDDGGDGGPDVEVIAPPAGALDVAWADETGVWRAGRDGDPVQVADTSACCVAFAPDGTTLAYLQSESRELSILTRDSAVAVSGTVDRFAWSPTQPVLAALVREGEESAIDVYDPTGTRLWRAPVPAGRFAYDFAWSADGTQLAYVTLDAAGDHLYVADVDRGRPSDEVREVPITGLPVEMPGLYLATWSPDGRYVLVWPSVGHSSVQDGAFLYAVDVTTGEASQLFSGFILRSSLQWSPGTSTLLGYADAGRMVTDERHVVACRIGEGCTERPMAGQTMEPAWRPDGTGYAFVVNRASTDPNDFLVGETPDWASRYAQRELWVANADGSGARRVEQAGRGVAVPRWVDDETIVFVRDNRLWQLDLDAAEPIPLTPAVQVTDGPTNAVYEPSDVNGFVPWANVFALALPRPASPSIATTLPAGAGSLTGISVERTATSDRVVRDFDTVVHDQPRAELLDDPPHLGESEELAEIEGERFLQVMVSANTDVVGDDHGNFRTRDPATIVVTEALLTYEFEGLVGVTQPSPGS